ncbi:hypothetical protein N9L68_00380 [bacterium]|nr:hypothetical protein [bacterium]
MKGWDCLLETVRAGVAATCGSQCSMRFASYTTEEIALGSWGHDPDSWGHNPGKPRKPSSGTGDTLLGTPSSHWSSIHSTNIALWHTAGKIAQLAYSWGHVLGRLGRCPGGWRHRPKSWGHRVGELGTPPP